MLGVVCIRGPQFLRTFGPSHLDRVSTRSGSDLVKPLASNADHWPGRYRSLY